MVLYGIMIWIEIFHQKKKNLIKKKKKLKSVK